MACLRALVYKVQLSGTAPNQTLSSSILIYDSGTEFSGTDIYNLNGSNQDFSLTSSSTVGQVTFTDIQTRLYVEYHAVVTTQGDAQDAIVFHSGNGSCTNDPAIDTPQWTIPEKLIGVIIVIPFIPLIARLFSRRKQLTLNIS